ncbi:MAG: Tfp pilus assembly protein FimT/FimU [Phycisphaerales bacterium]
MTRGPSNAPGCTLIETLLAIAVLGGVVLVTTPIVRSVWSQEESDRMAGELERRIDAQFELETLVDRFMLDSDRFGVAGSSLVDASTPLDATLRWPEAIERSPVALRRRTPTDEGAASGGSWLVFEWRESVVMRWTPLVETVELGRARGGHP